MPAITKSSGGMEEERTSLFSSDKVKTFVLKPIVPSGSIESCTITNFGGRIWEIQAKDPSGKSTNVVLSPKSLPDLYKDDFYSGAIVGRVAGRITKGEFAVTPGGPKFHTDCNHKGVHGLHGGIHGFSNKLWDVVESTTDKVVLSHTSPDGEGGYPGEVHVTATYQVDCEGLKVVLEATSTKDTILSMTIHPGFNLDGFEQDNASILQHTLQIEAERCLTLEDNYAPTGQQKEVAMTPFDFRNAIPIGARIEDNDPQLQLLKGYDTPYCLRPSPTVRRVLTLTSEKSNRILKVHTDQPVCHVYTANYVDSLLCKEGTTQGKWCCVAPECEGYPDAPNHVGFPSIALKQGDQYKREITFKFTHVRQSGNDTSGLETSPSKK